MQKKNQTSIIIVNLSVIAPPPCLNCSQGVRKQAADHHIQRGDLRKGWVSLRQNLSLADIYLIPGPFCNVWNWIKVKKNSSVNKYSSSLSAETAHGSWGISAIVNDFVPKDPGVKNVYSMFFTINFTPTLQGKEESVCRELFKVWWVYLKLSLARSQMWIQFFNSGSREWVPPGFLCLWMTPEISVPKVSRSTRKETCSWTLVRGASENQQTKQPYVFQWLSLQRYILSYFKIPFSVLLMIWWFESL